MQVNIKLFEGGTMPVKIHETDAGFDCYARSKKNRNEYQVEYELGFSIEIPRGYMGLMFPRSSICNFDLILSNCVGVVDSGYRGEVKAVFNRINSPMEKDYEVGERVCQMIIIPYPEIELIQVDELGTGERGANGFGSSGVKKRDLETEIGKKLLECNMAFIDWKNSVLDAAENKPEEWRRGQSVYNILFAIYPNEVGVVQQERHIDCFNDDSKIDDFLQAVYVEIDNNKKTITKNPLF
jgi:dUTP pyrophosphatase